MQLDRKFENIEDLCDYLCDKLGREYAREHHIPEDNWRENELIDPLYSDTDGHRPHFDAAIQHLALARYGIIETKKKHLLEILPHEREESMLIQDISLLLQKLDKLSFADSEHNVFQAILDLRLKKMDEHQKLGNIDPHRNSQHLVEAQKLLTNVIRGNYHPEPVGFIKDFHPDIEIACVLQAHKAGKKVTDDFILRAEGWRDNLQNNARFNSALQALTGVTLKDFGYDTTKLDAEKWSKTIPEKEKKWVQDIAVLSLRSDDPKAAAALRVRVAQLADSFHLVKPHDPADGQRDAEAIETLRNAICSTVMGR